MIVYDKKITRTRRKNKMKKIVSLILLASLVIFAFASCGGKDPEPTEKDYNLAVGMTVSANSSGKTSATAAVVVIDEDGKIALCRIDVIEHTVLANGEANTTAPTSKVDLGDNYGMSNLPDSKGEFYVQSKYFENYVVGKTLAEVKAIDISNENEGLLAGCTIKSSIPAFITAVEKAFNSSYKTAFKAEGTLTAGLKLTAAPEAVTEDDVLTGVELTTDVAGVVMAGGKVAAAILDTAESTVAVANGEAGDFSFDGTKREKGDGYVMPNGSWHKQADAYTAAISGKGVDEIADVYSEAIAGCTMEWTVYTYKANLEAAAKAAR